MRAEIIDVTLLHCYNCYIVAIVTLLQLLHCCNCYIQVSFKGFRTAVVYSTGPESYVDITFKVNKIVLEREPFVSFLNLCIRSS